MVRQRDAKNAMNMNAKKILLPALLGTTAMSIFSYFVSDVKRENYREPLVLAGLLSKLKPGLEKPGATIAGWVLHYASGVAFTSVFHQIWKRHFMKPTIASGIGLGAVSGLAGIAVWKMAFEAHPDPPRKNLKRYFTHLFWAHWVFGAFSALGYPKSTEESPNPQVQALDIPLSRPF